MLPGFIDTHAHFLWTALSLAALDVSGAQDHCRPAGHRPRGRRRNAGRRADPGHGLHRVRPGHRANSSPIIQVLDAAAPENPVYLIGVTGHTSALNSQALELLAPPADMPGVMRGADGQTQRPAGGRGQRPGLGEIRRLFGAGDKARRDDRPGRRKRQSRSGLRRSMLWKVARSARTRPCPSSSMTAPGLPLRFVLYYQTMDVDKVMALGLPRIGGCILLDGDVGPRTAALSEPYVDDPELLRHAVPHPSRDRCLCAQGAQGRAPGGLARRR